MWLQQIQTVDNRMGISCAALVESMCALGGETALHPAVSCELLVKVKEIQHACVWKLKDQPAKPARISRDVRSWLCFEHGH